VRHGWEFGASGKAGCYRGKVTHTTIPHDEDDMTDAAPRERLNGSKANGHSNV
jgi:hypothetical protein